MMIFFSKEIFKTHFYNAFLLLIFREFPPPFKFSVHSFMVILVVFKMPFYAFVNFWNNRRQQKIQIVP